MAGSTNGNGNSNGRSSSSTEMSSVSRTHEWKQLAANCCFDEFKSKRHTKPSKATSVDKLTKLCLYNGSYSPVSNPHLQSNSAVNFKH